MNVQICKQCICLRDLTSWETGNKNAISRKISGSREILKNLKIKQILWMFFLIMRVLRLFISVLRVIYSCFAKKTNLLASFWTQLKPSKVITSSKSPCCWQIVRSSIYIYQHWRNPFKHYNKNQLEFCIEICNDNIHENFMSLLNSWKQYLEKSFILYSM